MRTLAVAASAVLTVLTGAPAAHAQVARSGGDAQRASQQLQQLAAERTALQAENDRLKRELQAAKAGAEAATAAAAAANRRLGAAEGAAARLTDSARSDATELEETRTKLNELVGRYRELANELRTVETQRATLQEASARHERDLQRCAAANVELYTLADDVLGRFESTRRSDPFTQIARVRAENLVDEYRSRMAEQRIAPPTTDSARP